ncbi:MAG: hypothetical protein JSV53_09445 [candidate division WOR-3 bacterium]|nr:MAG: hypothetical protein JSV53_09445 [candidate division WOR-3 bacterium]
MCKSLLVFFVLFCQTGCLFFSLTTAHLTPENRNSVGVGYQMPSVLAGNGVYFGWMRNRISARTDLGFTLALMTDQPTEMEQSTHLPTGEESVGCIRFDVKYRLTESTDQTFCFSTGGMIELYYPFWPSAGARLMTSCKLPLISPYAGAELGVCLYYPYCYTLLGCELNPMEGVAVYAETSPTIWFMYDSWQSLQFGVQVTF